MAGVAGRVALVTGAGSAGGIGFATARLLKDAGARVGITSTTARIFERLGELSGPSDDAFAGTGTVTWRFSWSLNGADQGPFDELFLATTDFEIQVGEIQAVVTSG